MFCNQCGSQNDNNAKFCNDCGADLSKQGSEKAKTVNTSEQPAPQQPIQQPVFQQPKKKSKGCLIAILIVVAIFVGIMVFVVIGVENVGTGSTGTDISESQQDQQPSEEQIKEFDSKSWEDFRTMHKAHKNFMTALAGYGKGTVSKIDFYNYCKNAEEYFRNVYGSFNYNTNDDEKEYLKVFNSWAFYDQTTAKDLMRYLDSGKTSDLASAQENIEQANIAVGMIVSNRGILLKKAGYTDEEIIKIIERDTKELDAE